MKATNTALVFFIILSSCSRKKCVLPNNLSQLNWQQVDNYTCWYTCDGSGKKLAPGDKVTIEFLGIADTSRNLIPGFNDTAVLQQAAKVLPGVHAIDDPAQDAEMRHILPFMSRNTEYYVQYELKPYPKPSQNKLYIYFSGENDSLKRTAWLRSLSFADSAHYTSKNQALQDLKNEWGKDAELLTGNPLPDAAVIYVARAYAGKQDSLKELLLKNKQVAEVRFPLFDPYELLKREPERYALAAVFKIKT